MSAADISVRLDTLVERVSAAAENAVYDACNDLLRESRLLAPLDKGSLRTTAFTKVRRGRGEVVGEVVYNVTERNTRGSRANYALRVHEMGEFRNPTTPGTQPKFLEQPLKENEDTYLADIAEVVRRELE